MTVLRKLSPPPIRLRIACLSIVCLCASPLVAADVIVGIGDSVTKGDTARGVLSRLERDVISLEPTIVIIGVGDNDIIGNEAVAPPAPTAEAYFEVMDSMFSELKRNLPGASVFAMGMPTPVEKYTDMSWLKDFPGGEIVTDRTQAFFDAQFSVYNTVLRESAEQFGYHYVDIPSLWPSDVEESY